MAFIVPKAESENKANIEDKENKKPPSPKSNFALKSFQQENNHFEADEKMKSILGKLRLHS